MLSVCGGCVLLSCVLVLVEAASSCVVSCVGVCLFPLLVVILFVVGFSSSTLGRGLYFVALLE